MAANSSARFVLLNQLADEFAERYRNGERPAMQEYIDRHPDLAQDIRDYFPALVEMEQVKEDRQHVEPPPSRSPPPLEQLGDYRILREIGRGGMGIVYEAEQLSLGRRVALKVLPRQRLEDERLKRRFQREARAAARLHHTNIVPVFGVGAHEEVPYYVMQFIQGLGLDEVLNELKDLRLGIPAAHASTGGEAPARGKALSASEMARSLLSGQFRPADEAAEGPLVANPPTVDHMPHEAELVPPTEARSPGRSSSSAVLPGSEPAGESGKRPATYWQSVARIGVQVADALEHAHQQGVTHRDIKPSNLLLDARGTVWVTDFGLAKAEDQPDLTHTGDVLGTLRYMPPEAFDGKADARGDVYSLGLTLYEMLAMQPAFAENERNRLIRQVTMGEPVRLRKVNPQVPRDLETIVHKAIDRDPARRYPTAGEFAADLQRFLDDEPIRARRQGLPERCWHWGRRNPVVAALTATVAALLVVGTTVSIAFAVDATRARSRADIKAAEALENAQKAEREADVARSNLYVALVNRMEMDWESANVARILDTLEAFRRPPPGHKDLRGWEWYYQERLCRQETHTLPGHTRPVWGVAFSPNGKLLASAGDDEKVILWDAASGKVLRTLKGHKGWVNGVVFSPDGKLLASAGQDGKLTLWDVTTGKERLPGCQKHEDELHCVAFSPDGKLLAAGSKDGSVRRWDVATGKQCQPLVGHARQVDGVAFHPNGKLLASASLDQTVRLWDMDSGKEHLPRRQKHRGQVHAVAFSPNGLWLASAGEGGTVRLWDTASLQERLAFQGHDRRVDGVAFSPDGRRLASGHGDGTVKVWDMDTALLVRTFKGHRAQVHSVAFSPNGLWLASGGHDSKVKLWGAAAGQEFRTLAGHTEQVWGVAFSPEGTWLASASQDGKVKVWDTASGKVRHTLAGHGAATVRAVAFRRDGKLLASAGWDGMVIVWDLATGKLLHKWKAHAGQVQGVAFSHDGQLLASAGDHGMVKVWEVASGKERSSFRGHTKRVIGVAFHPDGKLLASAGWDGKVILWDVASGKELHILKGHKGWVNGVAFSPNGKLLASASHNRTVRLWDVGSGQELGSPLRGHTGNVWGVAFSPDGSRLASAGNDGMVKLWDVATRQELRTLRGPTGSVHGVAFSPDGGWLAAAGADRVVCLWDGRLWTSDIQDEVEAVALLDQLFARPMSPREVHAAIRGEKILSEAVRSKALGLLDRYKQASTPR